MIEKSEKERLSILYGETYAKLTFMGTDSRKNSHTYPSFIQFRQKAFRLYEYAVIQ